MRDDDRIVIRLSSSVFTLVQFLYGEKFFGQERARQYLQYAIIPKAS